jgi:hypothetical protein
MIKSTTITVTTRAIAVLKYELKKITIPVVKGTYE